MKGSGAAWRFLGEAPLERHAGASARDVHCPSDDESIAIQYGRGARNRKSTLCGRTRFIGGERCGTGAVEDETDHEPQCTTPDIPI